MSDSAAAPQSQPLRREIAITGLGVVSPIGIGIDAFADSLKSAKTGIGLVEQCVGFGAPDGIGAEVKDFTEETAKKLYLKDVRKSIKLMCREIQLGVASALQAVEQSGVNLESCDHERLGVEFGANLMLSTPASLTFAIGHSVESDDPQEFDFTQWGESGLRAMDPLWLLKYLPNMPACHICIAVDARGPNNSLTLEEASGNTVVAEACRILERGAADMMVAGTTGTILHPIRTLHLALWRDLLATGTTPPEKRARPFDKDRTGVVVGEGAATLILEGAAEARARSAKILGYVRGFGSACVATLNHAGDYRAALAGAMRAALRNAGVSPKDIGHINAHGLGTTNVDALETLAIHDVFGDLGDKVPVTACKSFLGNSGAASGTLELASSLIALNHGLIPATLNYDTPDPACRLNIVANKPQSTTNKLFLTVNVTHKGQASAVVVEAA